MSQAGHARYRELCNSEQEWADEILFQYRQVIAEAHAQPVACTSGEEAR